MSQQTEQTSDTFVPEVLIPGNAARDVMLLRAFRRRAAWLPSEVDPVTVERLRIQGFVWLKPEDTFFGTPASWHLTAAGLGFLAWETNTEPNLNSVGVCTTCGRAHRLPADCARAT